MMTDQVLKMLLTVNKNLQKSLIRFATVTAYLKVIYRKSITASQIVLIATRPREVRGRNTHVDRASNMMTK